MTIGLNLSGAPTLAGVYQGTVSILATGSNNARLIKVTLTVTSGTAALILSSAQLPFLYTPGLAPPAPQIVNITSSLSGGQAWVATASAPWISISATSGTTPSPLSVWINASLASALSPGVYQGLVTISPTGLPIPGLTIAVSLSVMAPQAQPPQVWSIQNSASYASAIAQGSIFVIQGASLGPATLVQAGGYPLPPQLAGSSVKVTVGGTTVACPIFYTSAAALAAVLPSNTPVGAGQLMVTFQGTPSSYPTDIQVVKSTVGLYTVSTQGSGPGIITGLDYATKTTSVSAKPGDIMIAWATGLGPTSNNDAAVPTVIEQYANTEVFVGDRAAKVISATRSGCCAGLDQIAFYVPDGPKSCFVPVSVRTPGGSSNFVTLPVSVDGGPCPNPAPGIPAAALTQAASGKTLSLGLFAVGPVPVLQSVGFDFSQVFATQLSRMLKTTVSAVDVSRLVRAYRAKNNSEMRKIVMRYAPGLKAANAAAIRNLVGAAASSAGQQGAGVRMGQLADFSAMIPPYAADFPAVGTCTVLSGLGGLLATGTNAFDAGNTLTVSGPGGTKSMTKVSNGQYQALLGTSSGTSTAPGLYTIGGTGGKDVGPFSASLNVGNPFVWTNKSALATVDRTSSLTVTWTGGTAPGHMLIGGGVRGGLTTKTFLCIADTQAGTFTIPQFVISAMPDSPVGQPGGTPKGTLFLAPDPLDHPISVPGLDLAYIAEGTSDSRSILIP